MALYFFNASGQAVSVAFAYYDRGCGDANQNFRKQGWWQIENFRGDPGFLAWNVDLRTVNRFAYFYVEAANGSSWHGTGNAWLGVTDSIFSQCAFDEGRDDRWVDFIDLDFTWLDPGWDMRVLILNWEGKNKIQFDAFRDQGPGRDKQEILGIAPDVVS